MYNQDAFINILKRCQEQLSLNEFARKVDVNSGYLSKIINYERNNPPSPKILQKIANASKGITTYEELMRICGYIQNTRTAMEDEAIKSLEQMIERQVPGYSIVDIALQYIKRLEGRS